MRNKKLNYCMSNNKHCIFYTFYQSNLNNNQFSNLCRRCYSNILNSYLKSIYIVYMFEIQFQDNILSHTQNKLYHFCIKGNYLNMVSNQDLDQANSFDSIFYNQAHPNIFSILLNNFYSLSYLLTLYDKILRYNSSK